MAKTTSTSVEMMKREKVLETRRKELEGLLEEIGHEETEVETRRKELGSLLAEVSKEEQAVEKQLLEKGWVQQKDGSWSYE